MKTLLTIICCLLTWGLFAQKTEGVIEYKETIKLDIDLDGMEVLTEEMKAMFPSEQSNMNVLYFNKNASLYTNLASDEDTKDVEYKSDDEDFDIQIKMDMPQQIYYHDLATKEYVESKDLFGRKFLITGKEKSKWKFSDETKKILDYTCKKAISTTDDGKKVEVWFTTKIPLPIGPSGMNGLPGAILAVALNNGQYTIAATKINFKKVDAKKIVKPKKGKKVSNEEFNKIVVAKQKEMAEMYGESGNVIIKTEER